MFFKNFGLKYILIIIFCLINSFLLSQTDIDYNSRSSAYNFCSCVNKVFPNINEEIIDLYIESHTLSKFELNKKLSSKNRYFRSDYEKTILILNNQLKLTDLTKCLKEVKRDIYSFDVNIIDSGDNQEIFKSNLFKYLGFNFDCKLSIFFLKKTLTKKI